jgi:hypothetical protein
LALAPSWLTLEAEGHMPDDLDDFDLEPTRRQEDQETIHPYRPEPARKRLLFPLTLAAVAVVAVGLLAVLFLVLRHPSAPTASPAPAAPRRFVQASPPGAPQAALPSLDDSDPFVRQLAAGLSAHPEIARWLSRSAFVRTLTVVVVNVAGGETPRPHLEFLAPKQRFRASRRPGRLLVPDPAGFAGYDLFADAVASVDAPTAVRTYRALAPLFESAYIELGHPEGGFPAALDAAIRALLAVPVLTDDVALVPHAIGFRYADPKMEALTPAQKQFLRIGPRNVRLVQGKLREVAAALAAPATPSPQ